MARTLPALALAGGLLAAAAPAASAASNPASGICVVRDVPNVERPTVRVGVNIDDAGSTAARKARCGQVARVVRGLAREQAQMPMKVNGFACTPTVRGARTSWTCTYRGGSPRTTVELDFAFRYAEHRH
ncbi:MAG: hypothetical protein IRZ32_12030 [Solirubrobacteraceae bacterium]|nr:hypothetical protein [Solirubrobacteraceae bacterium]